jgi:hypothetical protein
MSKTTKGKIRNVQPSKESEISTKMSKTTKFKIATVVENVQNSSSVNV